MVKREEGSTCHAPIGVRVPVSVLHELREADVEVEESAKTAAVVPVATAIPAEYVEPVILHQFTSQMGLEDAGSISLDAVVHGTVRLHFQLRLGSITETPGVRCDNPECTCSVALPAPLMASTGFGETLIKWIHPLKITDARHPTQR
ncbi:hypothetical protein HPB50_009182 [Hyalomma asiaticum]|uniref:Uncharacterized protein n=1 Tax=Hyalomma asiaticum TaxID=266040 RepID=A0ACB7SUS7_HYAAI|nr:hypothetical protein HPB50_009182 [Hyalomma asiaticum]